MADIFNRSLKSAAIVTHVDYGGTQTGVDFTDNLTGALVGDGDLLSFPIISPLDAHNFIEPLKGTIEFWFSPNWDGYNFDPSYISYPKTLLYIPFNATCVMGLYIQRQLKPPINWRTAYTLDFEILIPGIAGTPNTYAYGSQIAAWEAGSWHHIKLYWDFELGDKLNYMMIEVDGELGYVGLIGMGAPTTPINVTDGNRFLIGQHPFHSDHYNANGTFKDFSVRATSDIAAKMAADRPGFNRLTLASVTGDFTPGETISQATSGSTGTVSLWDNAAGHLWYVGTNGFFDTTHVVTGASSGAFGTPNDVLYNGFDPWDGGASLAEIRAWRTGDGYCTDDETNAVEAVDCPVLDAGIHAGEDVLFFKKSNFAQVLPGYVPTENEIDTVTDVHQVLKGETYNLFVNIYTRIDLTDAQVTYGNFTGPGTITITKNLRVVKNWWKWGGANLPKFSPELMVHDDRIDVQPVPPGGGDTTWYANAGNDWPCPDLPLLDHCHFTQTEYTSRQLMMKVVVPADAAPGTYTCTLSLTATGVSAVTCVLSLEVVNAALRPSEAKTMVQFGTNNPDMYKTLGVAPIGDGSISPGFNSDVLWEAAVRRDLEEIKSIGCTEWIVVYGGYSLIATPTTTYVELLLSILADMGFQNVIWYHGQTGQYPAIPPPVTTQFETLKTLIEAAGFEAIFWGHDECSASPSTAFNEQLAFANMIHGIGAKIALNASKTTIDQLDDYTDTDPPTYPNGVGVDYPIPVLSEPTFLEPLLETPTDRSGIDEVRPWFYFWQCHDDLQWFQHRMSAGFTRWLSGMTGASPYLFQGAAIQALNDFARGMRQQFTTYPSRQGPIPTMQWEAIRAGTNDDRLLTTWTHYYNQAILTHPVQAAASAAIVLDAGGLLDKYRLTVDNINSGNSVWNAITDEQMSTDRNTIVAQIKTLSGLVSHQHKIDGVLAGTIDGGGGSVDGVTR